MKYFGSKLGELGLSNAPYSFFLFIVIGSSLLKLSYNILWLLDIHHTLSTLQRYSTRLYAISISRFGFLQRKEQSMINHATVQLPIKCRVSLEHYQAIQDFLRLALSVLDQRLEMPNDIFFPDTRHGKGSLT